MTTRAELRARIRAELNDAGATALWPDERLNQWIVEGLRDFGRHAGLQKSQTIASVAGQAGYPLAADVLQVARVEHPSGRFRVPAPFSAGEVAPGVSLAEPGPALLYDVWGGLLVLSPRPAASGEPIVVRYVGAYAEPVGDAGVLDVAAHDEDAIVFYACRRAATWIAGDEAKRQRFERQRGADPSGVAREYERAYVGLVRQRRGRVATRRLAIR
jgi:hypothetical protein